MPSTERILPKPILLPHISEPTWAGCCFMQHPASSRGSPFAALPQRPYLYALCSQDELGDYGRHILLIVDFVDHVLQERLQWCHSLQDDPVAQESVLKDEENQPWPHLRSKSTPSGESAQQPHRQNSSSNALGRAGCAEQAGKDLSSWPTVPFSSRGHPALRSSRKG